MKKGLLPKIVAALALLGILIGVVGTTALYIFSPKEEIIDNGESKDVKLTKEQLKQLQELAGTGVQNGTGEIKK